MTKSENYTAVCARLGYLESVRFVEITPSGSITFTCGKPDEIFGLLARVRACGMRPAKSLIDACRRESGGRVS
jgi:hypothetical protein